MRYRIKDVIRQRKKRGLDEATFGRRILGGYCRDRRNVGFHFDLQIPIALRRRCRPSGRFRVAHRGAAVVRVGLTSKQFLRQSVAIVTQRKEDHRVSTGS